MGLVRPYYVSMYSHWGLDVLKLHLRQLQALNHGSSLGEQHATFNRTTASD